jgi:hypothetical protein
MLIATSALQFGIRAEKTTFNTERKPKKPRIRISAE